MRISLKRQVSVFDVRCLLEGIGIILIIAFFFYRSFLAVPFLVPVLYLYRKKRKKEMEGKQKREIQMQFKDAILAVSVNQKAGYSVENSFKQAYNDMLQLYGKDSIICSQLSHICLGLRNNVTLEKLLSDFGRQSEVEDIIEFAEVFAAAKRSGGNLTEVIRQSAQVIEEKADTEKEIHLLLAARKMEQRIMNVIPFGILFYISVTSKGFFDVLYHNPIGIIIMTIALAVYLGAVFLSEKIVSIEV